METIVFILLFLLCVVAIIGVGSLIYVVYDAWPWRKEAEYIHEESIISRVNREALEAKYRGETPFPMTLEEYIEVVGCGLVQDNDKLGTIHGLEIVRWDKG